MEHSISDETKQAVLKALIPSKEEEEEQLNALWTFTRKRLERADATNPN